MPPSYPQELEHRRVLADGRSVLIRPIRCDDRQAERAFLENLCPESRRLRFMKAVRGFRDSTIASLVEVDYARTMAFVCEADGRLVGEARYAAIAGTASCEFGIAVADEWRGTGIAGLLMDALIGHARLQGFRTMEGVVLRENRPMLKFARALGFGLVPLPDDWTLMQAIKVLAPAAGPGRENPTVSRAAT